MTHTRCDCTENVEHQREGLFKRRDNILLQALQKAFQAFYLKTIKSNTSQYNIYNVDAQPEGHDDIIQ